MKKITINFGELMQAFKCKIQCLAVKSWHTCSKMGVNWKLDKVDFSKNVDFTTKTSNIEVDISIPYFFTMNLLI